MRHASKSCFLLVLALCCVHPLRAQTPVPCTGTTCSVSPASGDVLFLGWSQNGVAGSILPTTTCNTVSGTNAVEDYTPGTYPGGVYGEAWIRIGTGSPCTVTEPTTPTTIAWLIVDFPSGTTVNDNSLIEFEYLDDESGIKTGSYTTRLPPVPVTADTYLLTMINGGWSGVLGIPGFACATGTSLGNITNNGVGLGICLQSALPENTPASNTVSDTDGTHFNSYYVLIRKHRPTFGAIQQRMCLTGAGTCPWPFPPTVGDLAHIVTGCRDGANCVFSDNIGSTFLSAPGVGQRMSSWRVEDISSSSQVITCTGPSCGGGDGNWGMVELAGVASSSARYESVGQFDDECNFGGGPPDCPRTTFSSTPVHIVRTGEYYAVSGFGGAHGQIATSTAGFVPRLLTLDSSTGNLGQLWDQIIVSSSPQLVSNTPTWTTGSDTAAVRLDLYGAASQTDPHVRQSYTNEAAAPQITIFPNAIQTGDIVLVDSQIGQGNLPTSWSLADNFGGTITLCSGGLTTDPYATWVITNPTPTSGATVTVSGPSLPPFTVSSVVGPSPTSIGGCLNQRAVSTTVSTPTVTTTNSTSLILSWLMSWPSEYASYIYNYDPSWSLAQQGYGDYDGTSFMTKLVLAPGTWSNSGSTGASQTNAGVILSLELVPPPLYFGHTVLGNHASMGSQTKE